MLTALVFQLVLSESLSLRWFQMCQHAHPTTRATGGPDLSYETLFPVRGHTRGGPPMFSHMGGTRKWHPGTYLAVLIPQPEFEGSAFSVNKKKLSATEPNLSQGCFREIFPRASLGRQSHQQRLTAFVLHGTRPSPTLSAGPPDGRVRRERSGRRAVGG